MSRLHGALLVCLSVAGVAGCEASDSEAGAQTSDLVSTTKVLIVPVDDRARTLCREELNRYYCATESAADAAAACLAKIPLRGGRDACADGGEACLRYEVIEEPCAEEGEIYPTAESCAEPVEDTCTFYSACVEPNVACGEGGYALGYGEKYCTAFKNARFSPKGEAWVVNVMGCLQRSLMSYTSEDTSASCEEIQEVAFDSHPACYTDAANSICFLPPSDVLGVLSTIGGAELLAERTRKQIRAVIGTCIGDIAGRIFRGNRGAPQPMQLRAQPGVGASDRDLVEQYELWQRLEREYGSER